MTVAQAFLRLSVVALLGVLLVAGAVPLSSSASAQSDNSVEQLYWQSVKDTNSIQELQSYIARFPNGAFVHLAQIRIERLANESKQAGRPQEAAAPKAGTYDPKRPWLGVFIGGLTDGDKQRLRRPHLKGALISSVSAAGPANAAGLRADDLVLKINGAELADARSLAVAVGQLSPHTTAHLTIWRNEREELVDVRVGISPTARLGVRTGKVTDEMVRKLNLPEGAIGLGEVHSGSPAEKAGLRVSDVLLVVNGVGMPKSEQFHEAILKTAPGSNVLLTILREDKVLVMEVPLTKSSGE